MIPRARNSAYRKSILIIDDEEISRRYAKKTLESTDFEIYEAGDVESGIAKALSRRPTLVILDLVMRGGMGFEFLEKRRAYPELADTPVLVASSLNDRASVIKAISLGAADYVIKPFESISLLQKFRRLVVDPSFLVHEFPAGRRPKVTARVAGTITRVSEFGVMIETPVKIQDDTVATLHSKILEGLEYSENPFRSTHSLLSESGESGVYATEMTAIGLREETAKKIRKVIRFWK